MIAAPTAPAAGIDLDDARRKREDNIVQLRKDRRDENLQKKRMVSAVAAEGGELESTRGGQVQQKVRRPGDAFWACPLLLLLLLCCVQHAQETFRPMPSCSWSRCRRWCRACGARTRRRSSRRPPSSASCCPSVGAGRSWGRLLE